MDAIITGESERVGLSVIDNDGAEHLIEMNEQGDIKYHSVDDYPDDSADRSRIEDAMMGQAQRFAQFYVYRKRGYPTVDACKNPDRVMAAATTIGKLSEDTFETYFGDLSQQMRSHSGSTEPVVDVPDAVGDDPLYYQQDIYLPLDLENLQQMAAEDATPEELDAITNLVGASALTSDGFHDLADLAADAGVTLSEETRHQLTDLTIEALSDIRVTWWPEGANNPERTDIEEPAIDRDPDARIEMPPYEADSLADFQAHIAYHLKCQVRDYYLGMGIAPPEPVRVRGPGRFRYATWYEQLDIYQRYHRQDVDITDWQEQHTPDDISY